jgi:hypothetical protein
MNGIPQRTVGYEMVKAQLRTLRPSHPHSDNAAACMRVIRLKQSSHNRTDSNTRTHNHPYVHAWLKRAYTCMHPDVHTHACTCLHTYTNALDIRYHCLVLTAVHVSHMHELHRMHTQRIRNREYVPLYITPADGTDFRVEQAL